MDPTMPMYPFALEIEIVSYCVQLCSNSNKNHSYVHCYVTASDLLGDVHMVHWTSLTATDDRIVR